MSKTIIAFSLLLCFFSCKEKVDNFQDDNNPKEKLPPNVIVILIDDAGYLDFGFMGSEDLDTPHIDELARNGVIFTDAHVSATVCAPSRAGLITGQYQQRFGFEANHTGFGDSGDIGLAKEVTTIADVFKENNYKTAAIGKWHLGTKSYNHPNQRGFDEFYGFLGGGRSYFSMENPSSEHMLQYNGERIEFDGYLTDVLGDFSTNFVEKNQNTPFFMYLSYNAVHTPMEAKQEHLEKYKNHPRKELAAMTWSLDENIGKLTDKLSNLGMLDNTLIFFLSDNGGAHNNQSSTGKLKGWKGNKFEGGHRVPFVVSWPNKIKEPFTFDGLTSSFDIFKTSIEAANLKVKDDLVLDGENLMPYLTKEKKGNPHSELYWRKLEESAARVDDFKLISLEGYGNVLYNLENDISETQDLSKIQEQEYNRLSKAYNKWEEKMQEPKWVESKSWMQVTYHIHKQLMENKPIHFYSPTQMKKYHQKDE